MMLMNWTRSSASGITAFQVKMKRAKFTLWVQGRLVTQMQSIYGHEQMALALYIGLAARTADPVRRNVLLMLAQAETRQLARRAALLRRLNARLPCRGSLFMRLWQWSLIHLGSRCALAWIRFVKNGDVRRQRELACLLTMTSR